MSRITSICFHVMNSSTTFVISHIFCDNDEVDSNRNHNNNDDDYKNNNEINDGHGYGSVLAGATWHVKQ